MVEGAPGFLTRGTMLGLSPQRGWREGSFWNPWEAFLWPQGHLVISVWFTTTLVPNPTFLFLHLFAYLRFCSWFHTLFFTRKASFPFVCARELVTCTAVCIPGCKHSEDPSLPQLQ